jgi:hypothetical protein
MSLKKAVPSAYSPALPSPDNIELPGDCVFMSDDAVPLEAKAWLARYVYPRERELCFQWSPGNQRIVMPVYNRGELRGYQMRRIGDWNGPKYLTVKGKKPLEYLPDLDNDLSDHDVKLVFCEDLVSRYRLWSLDSVWGIPLLGLHFRSEYILQCLNMFPNAKPVIWFDNDTSVPWKMGPTKLPAEHLAALCAAVGRPAHIVEDLVDPKHYSDRELNDRLDRIA